jgi:nitrous oxidase accessory protein
MKRYLVFSLFILLGLLFSPVSLLAARPAADGPAAPNVLVITAESGPQALIEAVEQANSSNTIDTIEVYGGVYDGRLEIHRPLTLIGHDWPVIDGGGVGNVVRIAEAAPGTTITGMVIRNSGHQINHDNSGIVSQAANISLIGNRLEDTLFGINLRFGTGSEIRDNVIESKDLPLARRGDAIRIWRSNDLVVADNIITDGRDVIFWHSERLVIRGNEVSNGRYGLHIMYCNDALVENNLLTNNAVGVYLMHSTGLTLRHNTAAYNRGPSGYGLGLKDMDEILITENLFLDNRIGAHINNSPSRVGVTNRFEGNVFGYNEIGLDMMPSIHHTEFLRNSFVENQEQVAIGGGRMKENYWTVGNVGNYWSDYAGFDAAGDGRGDIPYQANRLFENMTDTTPALRLFLHSPVVNAVDFAGVAFPLFQPQSKLVDEQPLMSPIVPTEAPALTVANPQNWWGAMGLLLLVTGGLVVTALAGLGPIRSAYCVVRSTVSGLLRTTNYALRSNQTANTMCEDAMIEIANLTKRYGRFTAVNNLSFTVAPGEAVALWGANGAGKSTALHCLLDLTHYEGTITVNGLDARKQGKQVRAQVGFVPQMLNFHDDLTILETLDLYAQLKRVESDDKFAALLEKVDLTAHAHKRVDELSGGLKQRLALALALLADPPILLLDEPTASLDVGARAEFLTLLRSLKQAGKTLLFSSHHLDAVTGIADRILVMEGGTLVAAGPPAEMQSAWGLGQRNGQQGYTNGQHKDLQLEIVRSA